MALRRVARRSNHANIARLHELLPRGSRWIKLGLALVLLGALRLAGCAGQSGVQQPLPVSHSVALAWDPSTSAVVGYNVYRGAQMGGPYTKLNGSLILGTVYTDSTVQAGQTYFYVATAVDPNGVESEFSNEIPVTIPAQ